MDQQRRNLLGLMVAAGCGLGACSNARSLSGAAPGLDDPEQLLNAYQRLSGSLDNRLIIWWMTGTRYGVANARSTALYGMQVGMFHRFYRQPDGNYKLAFFELTYYTDLASGELLEEFDNPYTGKVNRVRHVPPGAGNSKN